MANRQLGVVVAGCGGISQCHTYALTQVPNARLIATVDIDEKRARSVKERFGAEFYSTDIDNVLKRDDVDAVVVTTANDMHAPLTIKALRAGKHVLVQKPMALDLAQAEEMVQVASTSPGLLMVSFFEFFHPAFARAKELVDAGTIGDVFMIKAIMAWYMKSLDVWRFDPKVAGGGVLFDGHSHHVAYALHLLGIPESISVYAAYGSLNSNTPVEDTGVTILRTPKALVEISGSNRLLEPNAQNGGGFTERIEIFGSKGTIHLHPTERPSLKVYAPGHVDDDALDGGWLAPRIAPVPQLHQPYSLHFNPDESPWVGEHQHWVDCCLERKPVVTDAHFGRDVQAILAAAYESGRTGRSVDVPLSVKVSA